MGQEGSGIDHDEPIAIATATVEHSGGPLLRCLVLASTRATP